MSELLSEYGYLVSGHPSLARRLGVPDDVAVVIRHFRLTADLEPRLVLLTLQHPDYPTRFDRSVIEGTAAFRSIRTLFPLIEVLVFGDSGDHFGVAGDFRDSEQLASWFGEQSSEYTTDIGRTKATNRSSNDPFVDWTAANITRACVVNDIDAVLPAEGKPGVLAELKRPRAPVERWLPYRADRANYESSAAIARKLQFENRTIAYNVGDQSRAGLHLDVRWNERTGTMESQCALLDPPEAISSPLLGTVRLSQCRSRN